MNQYKPIDKIYDTIFSWNVSKIKQWKKYGRTKNFLWTYDHHKISPLTLQSWDLIWADGQMSINISFNSLKMAFTTISSSIYPYLQQIDNLATVSSICDEKLAQPKLKTGSFNWIHTWSLSLSFCPLSMTLLFSVFLQQKCEWRKKLNNEHHHHAQVAMQQYIYEKQCWNTEMNKNNG